ncbi:MAG: hypothetical protein UU81_C0032G0004 [Microgenomates group bacterium GW2011_GWC1_41_8]|uniref:Uncharacterized protein n=2 Tax=Candidatus Roizmaniibacteriota TaxID=1752723 RepID=A0A0G0T3N1_9BACT|nr:MAG: hypothetical protein UT85_C0007G0023 [Candidatus Levybacteria bacterium GW2011_GWA2_40_16]KKR71658.1 MAG: hypothetical protein UU14_C0022G0006 [Candidatus Roizmanbacteria bacterium GW2011_GWB1_40_7]KKR91133.1 MAG: hypothetical protein UU41_C0046G0006 [Candidatus Roizmanbacteria bacterium GW2011_GWA1_41_13]KKS23326.1 MAG: hypothetical protein UU81_C0032G0004 [Microgenomates group bacterium GW2011_GWC1_41_8]OGK48453.1 MAG: hypothetical protein A3A55_00910 [Candidatus Roizmanbacteria bacte
MEFESRIVFAPNRDQGGTQAADEELRQFHQWLNSLRPINQSSGDDTVKPTVSESGASEDSLPALFENGPY